MKYETPELTALTPAINAIQGIGSKNQKTSQSDGSTPQAPLFRNEHVGAYADWE